MSLRARERGEDLLGSVPHTTASKHWSRICRLVFCQWLAVSAVHIIWYSLFRTVDTAALKQTNKKPKNSIYWSDPLKVHVIPKPEFVHRYYQVEPAHVKQEHISDNGQTQWMCLEDVRLTDKNLILHLWIDRRQPGYRLFRKVNLICKKCFDFGR